MAILRGTPSPLGCSIREGGVNFSVFSESPKLSLLLFYPEAEEPFLVVPLDPVRNRTKGIWHIFIPNLPTPCEYLYEAIYEDKSFLVHDPYAKGLSSITEWGKRETYAPRGRCFEIPSFDWEGIKKPKPLLKDLIIYEMHVRGFTQDPSGQVAEKGTFLGMISKIPHLLELGVNAVELLPVFEFDECERRKSKLLCNFWGYSTVNFFCPMQRYAFGTKWESSIQEFKQLVKELHRHKISVILDVVYNHTAEGGEDGPTFSFKGLGKQTYYSLDKNGNYLNFSGTGNTFNCNNPVASRLIVDSLSYWTEEMQVDGFRFDLASILTRAPDGTILQDPPILDLIHNTPALKDSILIAEAWDAAGLYQVGCFPGGKKWSEWNGRYRDTVRKFIKGTENQVAPFMQSICGSSNLYSSASPNKSINFVTCHDGFTLKDLVSYEEKHNEANQEHNQDGANDNESWNCGIEGETSNKTIILLRKQQMKNFQTALLLSLGIPMLHMGDEYGHTKEGNNNTYCQDNVLSWFLWEELENNQETFQFLKNLILFRKEKKSFFSKASFFSDKTIEWLNADWTPPSRFISYILKDLAEQKDCLVAFNADSKPVNLILPDYTKWARVIDTALSSPLDFITNKKKRPLLGKAYLVAPRSVVLMEAKIIKKSHSNL